MKIIMISKNTNRKKVYRLDHDNIYDGSIFVLGIFSSKRLAEKAKDKAVKSGEYLACNLFVRDRVLNELFIG